MDSINKLCVLAKIILKVCTTLPKFIFEIHSNTITQANSNNINTIYPGIFETAYRDTSCINKLRYPVSINKQKCHTITFLSNISCTTKNAINNDTMDTESEIKRSLYTTPAESYPLNAK
ncbi:MAG: hypothetical protein E7396_00760 [Ruminococcaceae bacterium]|nr:hypothetical protein [Oscillospiraceae bacterium]